MNKKQNDCPRFLVIQTAYIGDVILATSVLEALHQSYPCAQIDFLLKNGCQPLFHKHPYINMIFAWEKNKKKYWNMLLLILKLRKRKYSHVINLHRHLSSGIFALASGCKQIYGFKKNPLSFLFKKSYKHTFNNIHETHRNHVLLESLTALPTAPTPKLYPQKIHYEKINMIDSSPYITISPASVWHTKQVPVHKWVELISKIPEHINIYLLGSKNDKKLCQEIIQMSKRNNITNFAGRLELLETAALISKALLSYSNDSAPMHIASAMNAPVCAIFCSTVPAFGFAPVSQHAVVCEIKYQLSCRPCGIQGKIQCPKSHFKCANDLDMNDVYTKTKIYFSV